MQVAVMKKIVESQKQMAQMPASIGIRRHRLKRAFKARFLVFYFERIVFHDPGNIVFLNLHLQ